MLLKLVTTNIDFEVSMRQRCDYCGELWDEKDLKILYAPYKCCPECEGFIKEDEQIDQRILNEQSDFYVYIKEHEPYYKWVARGPKSII